MNTTIHAFGHATLLAACLFLQPNAASSATPSDWPRFRGPEGQGIRRSTGLPVTWSAQENIFWKTALPGPGGSSPIVFGDRVYVTCYSVYAVPGAAGGDLNALQRHVLCLGRADGKILWKKDVPAVQPEQAKVRDHGYASSTPLADADRLYVFFGKSGVFAFSHEGRELWRADVGSKIHGWGSASSPVVYQDLVIINAAVESDSLVALNRQTGKEVWRAGGMKESWNTPLLVPVGGGKQELVVAIFGKVLGLDPATGEALWSCATGIGWYMVPSLVLDRDVVYAIGGRGDVFVLAAKPQFELLARNPLGDRSSFDASPAVADGRLYIRSDKFLYCLGTP